MNYLGKKGFLLFGLLLLSLVLLVASGRASPSISGPQISPSAFSPNGDGKKDFAHISASFSPGAWTLEIRSPSGAMVRRWSGGQADWERLWPTTSPPPRFASALAEAGGKLYLFGGRTKDPIGNPVILGDTWTFDPVTDTWAQLSPSQSPPARHEHALTSAGGKVYLFGGILSNGQKAADTWVYDPATGDWSLLSPVSNPPPRSLHAMASLEGKVYLFGGEDQGGQKLNDTWVFDPATENWSQLNLSSAPSPRSAHALAALGGRIFLFGGLTSGGCTNDLWALDPSVGQWVNLNPSHSPSKRGGHALAAGADGQIYLFGGRDLGAKCAQAEFDDTWVYDPASNRWWQLLFSGSSGIDWPSKRESHSLAPAGGERLLLFGGAAQGQPQGDTWVLHTFSSSLGVVWEGTDQGGQVVGDGTYTVLLTVTDPGGLLDTASGQVTVDTQPPAFSLSSSPNPVTSPGVVSISLASTEPLLSPPLVTVTPPGGSPVPVSMSGAGSDWSGSYGVSMGSPEGSYLISASGEDAAGNQGQAQASFSVQWAPPGHPPEPSPPPSGSGIPPQITVHADPPSLGGPGMVTLTVESDQPLLWGPRLSITPPGGRSLSLSLSPAGTNRWTATYAIGACSPNGTYLVRAWGKDEEGDLGVGEASFQVHGVTTSSDTDPPRIRFWYPRSGSIMHLSPGENLTVYMLVEDGCVGVDAASTKMWANGAPLSNLSFSPRQGRISVRLIAPAEGTHHMVLEIPDRNGNLAVEKWYFRVAYRRR